MGTTPRLFTCASRRYNVRFVVQVKRQRGGGVQRRGESLADLKPYRELTPASLIGGVVVGVFLNMGICYAGLQIGFTIVGSTVAAVIGFGILRGILRQGSILEVNIFQTVASCVNTVNAGVIFTVPVLFLLGREEDIDYTALTLATIGGSVLGVAMIIPLRKQIIDFERLRFPEGVAVAAILKSPGAGVQKAKLLLGGIVISSAVAIWSIDSSTSYVNVGGVIGFPAGIRLFFAISLLSLGAGYLAGRPGLAILYGTLLNYWVLIPVCLTLGWVPAEFAEYSPFVWGSADMQDYEKADRFAGAFARFTSRHVGIGMILGGALAGIAIALPALKAAIVSLRSSGSEGPREEVPLKVLNVGLLLGFVMLLLATKLSGGEYVGWGKAFLAAFVGGLWLWLAGLVVAQTTGRTDWSPLSGLALIAIAILMAVLGTEDQFIIPAVTLGAAICVATSMCADMMADLKTGYLVGSRPIRQQIAQIATCWIGPGIALATVIVLWKAYGFGPDQARILAERAAAQGQEAVAAFEAAGGSPTKLPEGVPPLSAPQAGALQGAISIVQSANVPLWKYLAGAVLGVVISLLVSPGLGVMVGLSLYLPFEYMIVFGIGGVTNIVITRWKGARFAEDKGVPLAAGLIVGDALVGVGHALYKVLSSLGGS